MLEFANNFGKGLIYKGLDSDLSLRPRFSVGSNLLEMVLCHCDQVFQWEAICWNDEMEFEIFSS